MSWELVMQLCILMIVGAMCVCLILATNNDGRKK